MTINKKYMLPYEHEEIKQILAKVVGGYILTQAEYDRLNEIMSLNISEFSGSYDDLTDTPKIPVFVSDLADADVWAQKSDVERIVRETADTLMDMIVTESNETEITYANKVELENLTTTLQAYARQYTDLQISLIDLTGFARLSQIYEKADKVHNHSMADIKDLYYELQSKSRVDHTHNELYASKSSEHVHWNEEALENITNEKIQTWDNHVIETISELVELRTELHDLEDDFAEDMKNRHQHSNLDVLNKIFSDDVERWDAMNTFNTDSKLTTANVGGVSEGADLSGLSVQQILKRILYPDKKWEVTASLILDRIGSVFEKGTTVVVKQIKVTTVEQGSNPIKEIAFYINGAIAGTLTNPDSTAGTYVYDVNVALSDSVNNSYFRIQLKDSAEVIVKANTSAVNFYYPSFFGITNNGVIPNENTVKAFNKKIVAKGSQSYAYTMSKQCAVYVYPASYGDLSSIKDPSGFEQMNGFKKHSITMTINGQSVQYNMYIGPANTNTNFKLTFNF